MKSYDYCILGGSDPGAFSEKGAALGWDGLCLLDPELAGKLPGKGKVELVPAAMIEPAKAGDVRKEAVRMRPRFPIIVVRGLDEAVNRAAVETAAVDILLPAEEAKIDYVMAKLAKKNGVAIGFEFRQLLQSSGEDRSRLLSKLLETAKLVKKFGAPFVLTSGAMSEWDMRAPSELAAFGRNLGFDTPRIMESLSDRLLQKNRKRLGGKWVMPGVEVE